MTTACKNQIELNETHYAESHPYGPWPLLNETHYAGSHPYGPWPSEVITTQLCNKQTTYNWEPKWVACKYRHPTWHHTGLTRPWVGRVNGNLVANLIYIWTSYFMYPVLALRHNSTIVHDNLVFLLVVIVYYCNSVLLMPREDLMV